LRVRGLIAQRTNLCYQVLAAPKPWQRENISLRVVIAHSTATSPECIKKAGLNPGRGLRPKKGVYPSIIKNNPKRESCVIL